MKLLLTSGGIKNASIPHALVNLLEKPVAECRALCIPTRGLWSPAGQSGRGLAFHHRFGSHADTFEQEDIEDVVIANSTFAGVERGPINWPVQAP